MAMTQIPSRQGMPVAPFGMRSHQTEPHMPQLALLSPSVNSAELMEGLGESLNIEFDHSQEAQGAVETLYLKVDPNNPTLSKADIEELPPVPPYSPPRSQAGGAALTGTATYLNAAESSSTIKPTSGYFVLSAVFPSQPHGVSALALVDTGASCNFISTEVADWLGITYTPGSTVTGGASQAFTSYVLPHPLSFLIDDIPFTDEFLVVKDLLYPVILGVNWWRIHDARPCLMSSSSGDQHPSS